MNKPQVRFKGFDEEWQNYILKNACSSFKYGLNAAASSFDGKHKYLRITDIDDTSRQFRKNDLTSPLIDTFSDEFRLKPNDIVFARTGASVGKSYLYNQKDGEVYWAGFLICAAINDSFDSNFVFQTTLTNDYWKYIDISSQRSGQPGVNAEQYAELPFVAPLKSEQKKIGDYFRRIDEMINEVEREIGRLEKMKQASLQKMFPRPGQTIPEIRFAGFSEPWKTKRIDQILTIGNGCDYKHLSKGNIPVFGTGGLMTSVNSYLYDGETVFIGRKGTINQPYYYKGKFWTVDTLFYTHSFVDMDVFFVYCVFQKINWQNYNAATGVPSLSKDIINSIEINVPTQEEQKAIGDYFRNLDALLSAKRQKLVKLRNVKKACLDKMFVNSSEL